jgi:transposase
MAKRVRNKYTAVFRDQAVQLVVRDGKTIPVAAKELSMSAKTLANGVRWSRSGKLESVNQSNKPLRELEAENARLKRALAQAEMECDILQRSDRLLCQGRAKRRVPLPGTRGLK